MNTRLRDMNLSVDTHNNTTSIISKIHSEKVFPVSCNLAIFQL